METLPARKDPILDLLGSNIKAVKSVLPKHLTPERMLRIAYTATQLNPKLKECTHASLINAVLEASMLGLEIGGPLGLAHLVPYKQKATLIVGYKGFMDLAYRSDRITNFDFQPVYERDFFEYTYGLNPTLKHVPTDEENPGQLKYAYAVVNFKGGGYVFEVVNRRIALTAKNRSAARFKQDSPWNSKDDEWVMWCKTAVRRLAKKIPQSPELQRAAQLDELAEAGVDQGLAHVIDADFSVSHHESSDDLTEKLQLNADPPPEAPKQRTRSKAKSDPSPTIAPEEIASPAASPEADAPVEDYRNGGPWDAYRDALDNVGQSIHDSALRSLGLQAVVTSEDAARMVKEMNRLADSKF